MRLLAQNCEVQNHIKIQINNCDLIALHNINYFKINQFVLMGSDQRIQSLNSIDLYRKMRLSFRTFEFALTISQTLSI